VTVLPTIITKYAGIINDAVRHAPGPSEAAFRYLEAWQYYLSLPGFAGFVGINTAAILVMRPCRPGRLRVASSLLLTASQEKALNYS
jgi:hypothetical protein